MENEKEKPIFEVFYPGTDKHYKIYEDGKIKGFEPGAAIRNGIFPRINQLKAQARCHVCHVAIGKKHLPICSVGTNLYMG